MLWTKKYKFEEVEAVVRQMSDREFLDLYVTLHEIEPSYFSVKAGEHDAKHLRRVREILECIDILPDDLLATKNIALVCKAISKRHILYQLGVDVA